MEIGGHIDGAEEVFHSFDSCKSCFFEVSSAGDIEYIGCELCKTLRIYLIDISSPAAPDCCQTGTVGDIVDSAQFVFKLMACPVTTACAASCQSVVGETSCPQDFGSGALVVRFFHKDAGVVDNSLHEGFADAVSDLHGFNVYEVAFHGVHEDIYTAAFCLVLWEGVSESGI